MDLATLIASIASVPGIGPYMVYISFAATLAVTLCSTLATVMAAPTKTTGFYYVLYRLVNLVALSFGHARNLSAPSSTGIVGGPGAIDNPKIAIATVPASEPTPYSTVGGPLRSVAAFTLALLCLVSVSACSPNTATATAPVLSAATADIAKAEKVYGIAKGEAQVAALADPSLASTVNAAIAKADPIAAALQTATPAAAGIIASAASLIDQAVALENATAQAIKVVPSTVAK